MSQHDDNSILHTITFFLKKHTAIECNYEIHNNKGMAIVYCFEQLCIELEATPHPIQVLSNHCKLGYFIYMNLLNNSQIQWSKVLLHFNFKITCRLEKLRGKPDILMQQSGHLSKEEDI